MFLYKIRESPEILKCAKYPGLLTRPEVTGDFTKGVGPGPTLAWPGWKQPDIPVEVDTDRLETSRSEVVRRGDFGGGSSP